MTVGVVDGLALHGKQTSAASTGGFEWGRSSTVYMQGRIKAIVRARGAVPNAGPLQTYNT